MKFKEQTLDIEGTVINAETLNKGNWRDDDTLSFKVKEDSILERKSDETQIYTDIHGKTYLLPPGNNIEPVELGRTVGTVVEVGYVGKETVVFTSDPQEQIDYLKSDLYIKTKILDFTYPVGSIYQSVINQSPASFLGGDWLAWGAGRVVVGIGDNGETNYAAPESTGGSENSVAVHTHTITQTNSGSVSTRTPNHTHTLSSSLFSDTGSNSNAYGLMEQSVAVGGKSLGTSRGYVSEVNGGSYGGTDYVKHTWTSSGEASFTTPKHTHILSNDTAGLSGGNCQPYITCYMWKRIA